MGGGVIQGAAELQGEAAKFFLSCPESPPEGKFLVLSC